MIENTSDEYSCCFIHIPKTGGTSIERAFGWYQGNRGDQDHKTLLDKIESGAIDDSTFVFTFVRNPWDRMVSWYRNVIRDERKRKRLKYSPREKFSTFVEKTINREQFLPQTHWVENPEGHISMNFVGRFENLQSDFDIVCQQVGKELVTLPHEVASKSVDYREFYDLKSKQLVSEFYSRDIVEWGYEF